MKMSPMLLVTALLIAALLATLAEEAARKRARRPFVPIDLCEDVHGRSPERSSAAEHAPARRRDHASS